VLRQPLLQVDVHAEHTPSTQGIEHMSKEQGGAPRERAGFDDQVSFQRKHQLLVYPHVHGTFHRFHTHPLGLLVGLAAKIDDVGQADDLLRFSVR
jgi:hypothetical protein